MSFDPLLFLPLILVSQDLHAKETPSIFLAYLLLSLPLSYKNLR